MEARTATGPRLVFLHTAQAHRATFQELMRQEAPGLAFAELVDEALLARAVAAGGLPASLREDLKQRLQQAAAMGAEIAVCSCSTLGGAAEGPERAVEAEDVLVEVAETTAARTSPIFRMAMCVPAALTERSANCRAVSALSRKRLTSTS